MKNIVLRSLLLLSVLWGVNASATQVRGRLLDGGGKAYAAGALLFELKNCDAPNTAFVDDGSGKLVGYSKLIHAGAGGQLIDTILGNDQITCGGVHNTYWHVTPYNGTTVLSGGIADYTITGALFDYTTQTPLITLPAQVTLNAMLLNPVGSQVVTQPGGTSLTVNGTVAFTGAMAARTIQIGNIVGTALQTGQGIVAFGDTMELTKIAAPSNPASGKVRLYADTSSGFLACLTSAGTTCFGPILASQMPALSGDVTSTLGSSVLTLNTVATAGTNTKVTYNIKGLVTSGSQAQFSDIGGSVAPGQMPALTGDVTMTAGTTATSLSLTGAVAGTYTKVTIDNKGRVSLGATAAISDLTGSITVAQGGTGNSVFAVGDLLYASGTTTLTRLPIGANGLCFVTNGTVPSWGSCTGAAGATLVGNQTFTGTNAFAPTVAAGTYGVAVNGAAGAARDVLQAGETGSSAGLTVQWNGTNMVYTMANGGLTLPAGSISTTGTGANYLTVGSSGANTLDRGIRFRDSAAADAGFLTVVPNTTGTNTVMQFYVGGNTAGNIAATLSNNGRLNLPETTATLGIGIAGTPQINGIENAQATAGIVTRNTLNTSYASMRLYNDINSAVRSLEIDYSGSAYATSLLTGGPSGESAAITTTGAYPLVLGVNNTARMTISSGGDITFNPVAASTFNNSLMSNSAFYLGGGSFGTAQFQYNPGITVAGITSTLYGIARNGDSWFQAMDSSGALGIFGAFVSGNSVRVGSYSAASVQLGPDGNGEVEIGPVNGVNKTPFIDFHFHNNSATYDGQDFNIRMINDGDGVLAIASTASTGLIERIGLTSAGDTYGTIGTSALTGGNFTIQSVNNSGTSYGSLVLQPDGGTLHVGGYGNVSAMLVAGALGQACDQTTYQICGAHIGASTSIYSYGLICIGNTSGDCGGTGGVVLSSTDVVRSGVSQLTKEIVFRIGSDASAQVLQTTDDEKAIFVNRFGATFQVTEISCISDAGSPTIMLQSDNLSGTTSNFSGSDFTCPSNGATYANSSTITNGYGLNFLTQTPGGVAKRVTVVVKGSI